jgi:hypothetical protein
MRRKTAGRRKRPAGSVRGRARQLAPLLLASFTDAIRRPGTDTDEGDSLPAGVVALRRERH